MKYSHIFLGMILVIGIVAFLAPALPLPTIFTNWGLISAILVILAITAFFIDFERASISSKEIALVGMLATVATVLRVAFAAMPGAQPCTYLIICSGFVFGPVAGFMVGSVTTLVSNFFLGHGPWTLYQIFAWGMAGVTAAYMRRFKLNIWGLVVFGVFWGYAFGVIMNLWFWTSFVYPLTPKTFLVAQLNSIWFDTFHAIGNAIFLALFGRKTIVILERFHQRFQWGLLKPGSGPKSQTYP
jgi:energy-coupling factor transport system substrate-specific component